MNTKHNLHINIKHFRLQKGLSQTQIAEKIGVSRQAISNWESGKTYPDLDNIVLLCKVYEITTDELLGSDAQTSKESTTTTSNQCSVFQKEVNVLGNSPQIILELLCLSVILILASQFAFLGLLVPIATAIWLKKTNRKYKIIYFLCVVCFLICLQNTYAIFEHLYGTTTTSIEVV